MARTISQIKNSMTQQFMADSVIIEKYGFAPGSTFTDTFSAVSLESIWFSIVAAAIYVLETLFDAFREDVDAKIAEAVVASIPWYHKISLEFQYGDSLVFDEKTQGFVYPVIDTTKLIVKYAACRDLGGMVYVLASKDDGSGSPTALSADELTAFDAYLHERKPAGVLLQAASFDPDEVRVAVTVQYNPQVLSPDGQLIAEPGVYPVEEAIDAYLKGIVYGGALNKTKLVDAIQAAAGVIDVSLTGVSVKTAAGSTFTPVAGNNYTSVGGSFLSNNLRSTISYVLSL
jgi:hypothetical protein